jgi:hypothetical protein
MLGNLVWWEFWDTEDHQLHDFFLSVASKHAGKLAMSTVQEEKSYMCFICNKPICLECREFVRNVLRHNDKPRSFPIAGYRSNILNICSCIVLEQR